VVITDRYMDSSIAYQGAGRDLAATEVARISRWATGGLVPDLTVVLDVDPTQARERFTEALDRLESEPTEFHARVRAGFLALAAADPVRYLVVDAGQAPALVTTAIRHRLDRELPLSEQEKAAQLEQERLAREEAERRAAEEAKRKAEAEEAERKRLALLEQLRAEQAEKERLAKEEAERKAAEEARRAAEAAALKAAADAARLAEEAAERKAAEEARLAAEAAERDRLAAEAAQQAELQRQRDVQREEQRRRAEEALQRAEATRLAEEAAAAAAAANDAEAVTTEMPLVGSEELTEEISEEDRQAAVAAADAAAEAGTEAATERTAVLPKATEAPVERAEKARTEAPRAKEPVDRAEAPVERTAVLPPVRPVEERMPPGLWRPEPGPAERTRELPTADQPRPSRPSWAEETPMDDLPSLTDSLLGTREEWARWEQAEPDDEQDDNGRKRRK
jgi:dTMP kinase